MLYALPVDGQWITFDDAKLIELANNGKSDIADTLRDAYLAYTKN